MLPDTSITNAKLFSDFKFRNLAKMSSPTVERTSLRKILVASIAMSAAILCKLQKKETKKKKNKTKKKKTKKTGQRLINLLIDCLHDYL